MGRRYKIKRFSVPQSVIRQETDRDPARPVNSSLGERVGAATKVIGLGTALTAGAGYGIAKGAQSYALGKAKTGLISNTVDSLLFSPAAKVKGDLLKGAGKSAGWFGGSKVAGHFAKKAGKAALIAGGIGLTGAGIQKYYKNKKRDVYYR